MKYSPLPYADSAIKPVGAFESELTPEGWSKSKFNHELDATLTPDEISEFTSLVYSFFKEAKDRKTLDKFVAKHCDELKFDGFDRRYGCRFECDLLDCNVEIINTHITFYLFRKGNA